MLELIGVSKSFGATQLLQSVSLHVPVGRTTVLLGPSGCGKSTLLRLIIGLLRPDEGEVCLDGVPITPENELQIRRRMGYVLQDGGLFPHLTARGNITLMARHLGWEAGQIRSRVEELRELTRFPAEALDRYPAEMSGGQRQRVGIMRGLMLDPSVLLLDEPMGALDPLVRSELQADLRRIFRDLNKTVVLVTHDIGEAGFLGDRIALMKEGRIVQNGTLEDLVRRPADSFVTEFINAQRSPLDALGTDTSVTAEAPR